MTIFDLSPDADTSSWQVEDDTVMGGVSQGHFELTDEGYGRFHGHVSLENNGGFSSVHYQMPTKDVSGKDSVTLRVKGDGKRYQLRLKSTEGERHSYINYFQTSGEWEEITLSLSDFTPTWRGEDLDLPNYPAEKLTDVAFLIGNKKEQDFALLIDWLRLE